MKQLDPLATVVFAGFGLLALRYGTRLRSRAVVEDPQARATISANARQFRMLGVVLFSSALASTVMFLFNRR